MLALRNRGERGKRWKPGQAKGRGKKEGSAVAETFPSASLHHSPTLSSRGKKKKKRNPEREKVGKDSLVSVRNSRHNPPLTVAFLNAEAKEPEGKKKKRRLAKEG